MTQLQQAPTAMKPAVAMDLQATLVELTELSLQGKQAHWNVTGPQFRSVHLELDEIVDAARLSADRVAERIVTLGLAPDGRAETVAAAQPFDPFPAGSIGTAPAVVLIGSLIDELADRLHERIDRLAAADPVSQGILISVAEELEKQAWMLRAQMA